MIVWIKRNWALVILILVSLNWLLPRFLGVSQNLSLKTASTIYPDSYLSGSAGEIGNISSLSQKGIMPDYYPKQVPPTDTANRLVIQDTSLSLQVKNVEESIKAIEATTKNLGGFLVNSFLSKPESAASGNITIRVPEDKRSEALNVFKNLSVKVVSESVFGVDVTDQFVDIESRLAILDQTKQKFQTIMDRAVTVTDLMNVQQQLINLQSQIDSLKGQQLYLQQSAKLTKIVVYLSTDDLSLPYSPTNVWRPTVIFKQAVRSLIGTARSVGTLIIWLVVYSPLLIVVYLVYRYIKNKRSYQPKS